MKCCDLKCCSGKEKLLGFELGKHSFSPQPFDRLSDSLFGKFLAFVAVMLEICPVRGMLGQWRL